MKNLQLKTILTDGCKIAEKINAETKRQVASQPQKPGMTIYMIGDNPISNLYISKKQKKAQELGIKVLIYKFEGTDEENTIIEHIKNSGRNKSIHGIMVQLPVPKNFNTFRILSAIPPEKDIDGLNYKNLGKLWNNQKCFISATVLAIMECLNSTNIELSGKHALIINHSVLIGKPLAAMLLNKNCTVTIAHQKTNNLRELTRKADIIISATGQKGLISKEMIKDKAILIDVGIKRSGEKIYGDINKNVIGKAAFVTPVPGGVGPVTIAMLLRNLVNAAKF